MLSIYSMYPVYYPPENLTRNHFGLTGAWSRVRSHMGSAYFSLPSGWAQPNMHKAQCRGHPVCVHRVLLEECREPSSYRWWCRWKNCRNTDGWGELHLRVHLVAAAWMEAQEVSKQLQLHLQLLRSRTWPRKPTHESHTNYLLAPIVRPLHLNGMDGKTNHKTLS